MLSIEVYERQLGHVDQLRNEWTRSKIADTLDLSRNNYVYRIHNDECYHWSAWSEMR